MDDRLRIAVSGTRDNPHAHLDPVVSAEISWGNRVVRDWYTEHHVGYWEIRLERPLHVELLRKTFRFPPTIGLAVTNTASDTREPVMTLSDYQDYVWIST